MTGIIKGFEVRTNRNSSQKVLMLQVEISGPDDVQSVEWYNPGGVQSVPLKESIVQILQNGKGWKVAVSANDNIDFDESLNEGDKKIYSSDGTIKSTIILKNDGTIEINGNADFAVAHTDLNTDLQAFITDINAKLVTALTTAGSTWPGTSIDISAAKVATVKLP